jgi:hypothetical protein
MKTMPVGVCRAVSRRGSHIVQTIGSTLAVRLSALLAGRALSPEKTNKIFVYVRG